MFIIWSSIRIHKSWKRGSTRFKRACNKLSQETLLYNRQPLKEIKSSFLNRPQLGKNHHEEIPWVCMLVVVTEDIWLHPLILKGGVIVTLPRRAVPLKEGEVWRGSFGSKVKKHMFIRLHSWYQGFEVIRKSFEATKLYWTIDLEVHVGHIDNKLESYHA